MPTKAKFDHPQMKDTFCVFYHGTCFVYVCDTFKEIVEDYEPGVHQFFPIDFVWKDGSPAMRRYLFNVCNRVEYIDLGRSDVETRFNKRWQLKRNGKLYVRPKAVKGMAFWRDKVSSFWLPFVAPEIKEKIEASGMKGPVFKEYLPEYLIEQD